MIGIAGGTGFIGTHLCQSLTRSGFAIRLLDGDIEDHTALQNLCAGCDTIIHLVGLIREQGTQNWNRIHVEGTRLLVEAAKEAGVKQFIYVSAAGANKDAGTGYLKTKGIAESIVKESGIPYTIFRPSFVVGPGDKSINLFSQMIRALPIVPVIESGARFQPVSILDLVHCIQKSIALPSAQSAIFEIGGPEKLTMVDIYRVIGKVLGVRRLYLTLSPKTIRWLMALWEHLPFAPLSLDQLTMIELGSTCDTESAQRVFGIDFMRLDETLALYLR